jgi:hypothetical protein
MSSDSQELGVAGKGRPKNISMAVAGMDAGDPGEPTSSVEKVKTQKPKLVGKIRKQGNGPTEKLSPGQWNTSLEGAN